MLLSLLGMISANLLGELGVLYIAAYIIDSLCILLLIVGMVKRTCVHLIFFLGIGVALSGIIVRLCDDLSHGIFSYEPFARGGLYIVAFLLLFSWKQRSALESSIQPD